MSDEVERIREWSECAKVYGMRDATDGESHVRTLLARIDEQAARIERLRAVARAARAARRMLDRHGGIPVGGSTHGALAIYIDALEPGDIEHSEGE